MAVDKTLRTTIHGHPIAQVTGTPDRHADVGSNPSPNMGYGDVRGDNASTQVITLGDFTGTDSFKIVVKYAHPELAAETTAAIVRGTNATAAGVEAALENLDGIADATVTGTTDAGPFTVTFVTDAAMPLAVGGVETLQDRRFRAVGAVLELSTLSGCSGHVTVTDPSYASSLGLPGEVHKHGTSTGVPAGTFPGAHAGDVIPLGYSANSLGFGHTPLLPPTIDSAIGGSLTVAILGTEDASGDTVLYVICKNDPSSNPNSTMARIGQVESVQTDADADVAATTLTAGEKYLIGYSLTTAGRISKPSPREFFTVTA